MKHFIFLLLLGGIQVGCSKESQEPAFPPSTQVPTLTSKELAMVHPEYIEHYTMTEKNQQQYILTIQTVAKLLALQISLAQASPVLGEGDFIYPKDPYKPVTRYSFANYSAKLFDVGGELRRKDENSPFYRAGLSRGSNAEHFTTHPFTEKDFTQTLGLTFVARKTVDEMTMQELLERYERPLDPEDPLNVKENLIERLSKTKYAEYHYEQMLSGQRLLYVFNVDKDTFTEKKEAKHPKVFNGVMIVNESLKDFKPQSSRVGQPCPATGMWFCQGVSPESGIYMRKGDPMPGQSYSAEQRATMEWRLVKPMDDKA